jgi:hypothetical protein
VDFGGLDSLLIQVVPERWTPDNKPPRVEDGTIPPRITHLSLHSARLCPARTIQAPMR